MPASRQKHCVWVEELFLSGKQCQEICDITGLTKNVVVGIVYRGRQNGRLPRPVYTQVYDNRRNSSIRRGTIGRVLDRLTPEQHKHLTDTALEVECDSLADMIAAYVIDGICEEMGE